MRYRLAACLCLLILVLCCQGVPLQAASPVVPQEQKSADQGGAAQEGEKRTIVDLFTWAGLQRQEFIDLETELDGLQDHGEVAGQLSALTGTIDLLEREIAE